MVVFKKYFTTIDLAIDYARKPEKIANRVYGGRLGNGPEESGDGWRYRGRGLIQLTGKYNYEAFAKDVYKDNWEYLFNNPDLVSTDRKFALMSAIWFWNKNNLNVEADKVDIKTMTLKINGDLNSLLDRVKLYDQVLQVLG